jgi:TonB-linked SusC/RagA family outer membrane protein
MKKIAFFFSILLFMGNMALYAQTRVITGTVTSAEDDAPIPGVSIAVKGTTLGTITDIDGEYTIQVPQDANVLIFSFVGMQTQEVEIIGTTINVVMESDVVGISEVVVTANAIRREKRELGYSVTSVEGTETTKARDANVLNSLAGKVSGVRITQQSGTLGGSSKILIRGANSLTGENQPLFVVDGVPISNSGYNGTRNEIIAGGVDVGNRASDINPDDIESLTVLKGAAATALYGARAKDGAIIITTKRARRGAQRFSVAVNSSLRMDNVLKLPDLQNEYGPGNYGIYSLTSQNGWGPKISEVQDQKFENFLGDEVTLQAYPDNVENFYETGISAINNVSFSGGASDHDYRVSITNLHQTGVVPHTSLDKTTLAINAGKTFSDKLSARSSFSYARTMGDGKPAQGSNNVNVLGAIVNSIPRTMDIELLRDNVFDENNEYQSPNGRNANNPFWITQFNKFENLVDRFFGSATLTYNPFSWLEITDRAGSDLYREYRRQVTRMGTFGKLNGAFSDNNLYSREINNDIMATITKDNIIENLNFKMMVGNNINQRDWQRETVTNEDLIVDQLYNYGNAESTTTENFESVRRLWGLYYDVLLDYRNMLFLNLTGRNDWSSTLPKENNSYFYPSFNLGFVFTELMQPNDIITYGKLRANYANVGSDEDPYQLDFQYYPATDYFVQYTASGTFPHGGVLAYEGPSTLPPGNTLLPQNQKSYELGAELKFLNNRMGIDFTYYNTVTEDQIVSIAIPQSTGYNYKKINAGAIKNEGYEFDLIIRPVQLSNSFTWDINANFASNRNTVEELAPGLNEYTLTSGWSGLQIKAVPGETIGMYGTGWDRDPDGNVIINANTGLRTVTDNVRLGDIYPDWTMGIANTFSFKNLSLYFLIDIRQGGVIYSNTTSDLRWSGLAKETLAHRGETFVDNGVNEVTEGENTTYTENTTPVRSMQEYWQNYALTANTEASVFDASFIKLREVTFSYDLPRNLLRNTFIQGATIGVEGRNLWIIQDHVPHVDPEANFFGTSLFGEGVEFSSVPSTRSWGFNLKLNF